MSFRKLKGYDVRVSHYDGVTRSYRPMFTYKGVAQKDLTNIQVWLDLEKIRSKLS